MTESKRRVHMLVSFVLPVGVSAARARAYVMDAVRTWKGGLEPPGVDSGDGTLTTGDPMFDLDAETVKVMTLYR